MSLTADFHVHSEYSWDTGGPTSPTARGTMERTCARAVEIGLPALAFTEHLDFDGWWVDAADTYTRAHYPHLMTEEDVLVPPALDVDGYFESIDRCRHRVPTLQILTGVEFGQPHLCEDQAAQVLDLSALDHVNGSLHTLRGRDGQRVEPLSLFPTWPADEVVWQYLSEVPDMVENSDQFAVFTHIDYAVRHWPVAENGPFDPKRFEDGFRQSMRSIAGSGRALEMNVGRLRPWIPQWWKEEGGRAVTIASDAHTPQGLAVNFPEAMAMVEHFGFRPGSTVTDFWTC